MFTNQRAIKQEAHFKLKNWSNYQHLNGFDKYSRIKVNIFN